MTLVHLAWFDPSSHQLFLAHSDVVPVETETEQDWVHPVRGDHRPVWMSPVIAFGGVVHQYEASLIGR